MPALQFLIDQQQLPAGLSTHRCIFLRASHQVGNHIIDGAKGEILAYAAARMCQVEGDIVAHAIELAEVDMGMVEGEVFFLQ